MKFSRFLQLCWECVMSMYLQSSTRWVVQQADTYCISGVCVFIALAWIIWTCVFIPQMTQKDISFVADFLSEHFSEVWPELRRLPLKLIKRVELVCGYLIAPSLIEWRALRSQGKVLQRRTSRSGKRLCLCCKASVLFFVFWRELWADSWVFIFSCELAVPEGWGRWSGVSTQHKGEPVAEVLEGEQVFKRWTFLLWKVFVLSFMKDEPLRWNLTSFMFM